MISALATSAAAARPTASIRQRSDDFRVVEELSFAPSGEGEHAFLRIRKTDISTHELARELARAFNLPLSAVGYAGMKDKWSVSEQWFSVPVADVDRKAGDLESPHCQVLEVARHGKKLRRGEIAANRFDITLRDCTHPSVTLSTDTLARFANGFGAQRFGGDNLPKAKAWLKNRRRRNISRFKEGLYLSVLRSMLFNAVLELRIEEDSWASALPGDVLDQHGLPTGPLWGRGRSASESAALEIESRALAPYTKIMEQLEFTGLSQDRRSLVGLARDLEATSLDAHTTRVTFALSSGSYATVFLSHHYDLVDCGGSVS